MGVCGGGVCKCVGGGGGGVLVVMCMYVCVLCVATGTAPSHLRTWERSPFALGAVSSPGPWPMTLRPRPMALTPCPMALTPRPMTYHRLVPPRLKPAPSMRTPCRYDPITMPPTMLTPCPYDLSAGAYMLSETASSDTSKYVTARV